MKTIISFILFVFASSLGFSQAPLTSSEGSYKTPITKTAPLTKVPKTKQSWKYLELSNDPFTFLFGNVLFPTKIGLGYRNFEKKYYGWDVMASYSLVGGVDILGKLLKKDELFLANCVSVEASFLPIVYKGNSFPLIFQGEHLLYFGAGGGAGFAFQDFSQLVPYLSVYISSGIQINTYNRDKHPQHIGLKIGSPTLVSLEYGLGF